MLSECIILLDNLQFCQTFASNSGYCWPFVGDGQYPPNEEGVAICLYNVTATDFVTQELACLLLLPQTQFDVTLREDYT